MNESHITGLIASATQFTVAIYALWLNRRYGTARVGWSLFGAFAGLALLQLVQCSTMFNATLDAALKINVVYAMISFLLLIGMLHLESMLKERTRAENVEKQLRADLEIEVKLKTAYLTRAIEELMQQMDEGKRMANVIGTPETASMGRVVGDFTASLIENSERIEGVEKEDETTLTDIRAEWIAHF